MSDNEGQPARIWGQVDYNINEGNRANYPDDGFHESVLKEWEKRPSDKMARIELSLGNTINIGKYNSVRVNVGIELPSGVDEIEEAYDFGLKFCKGKLKEVTSSVEANMGQADSFADLVEAFGDECENRQRNTGKTGSRRRSRRNRDNDSANKGYY